MSRPACCPGEHPVGNAHHRQACASSATTSGSGRSGAELVTVGPDPLAAIRAAARRRWDQGPRARRFFSEYFSASDIEVIRGHELDFILRFAFGIVRGEILRAPRYGTCSFHHDDAMRCGGGPPAFWEIYDGDPHTGVVLQRVTERLDGGVVLRKHAFDTVVHSYSRNWDVGLFGGAAWPAEVCRDLLAGKAQYLDGAPSASTAPIFHAPSSRKMLRFAVTLGRNYLRHCIRGRRSTSQLE